ncbi:D-inositol-3-phosphate glycosyltransferase [uncultured archaeon]|nr:D-inositol-3-phosphate glycosyltransferase [uncultured archaeon]
MKKVLFLTTELHKPFGGLFRFAIEFIPAWKSLLLEKETDFEPVIFSLKDPLTEPGDLILSEDFKKFMEREPKVKIYEGTRGGEKAYFIEALLDENEKNEFHKMLWEKYRIKSDKTTNWGYYHTLNAFWKYVPMVAKEYQAIKEKFTLIDAQDWLAFPAGFLAKEELQIPLLCRFHSGEFGRSLGNPDLESPPLRIETASLMEADYIQGVSCSEAKYEVFKLLPLVQELVKELKPIRSEEWFNSQLEKQRKYEQFLLLESEDLELITNNIAGIPNGISLESWMQVNKQMIKNGRQVLKKMLPGKEYYIIFEGRTEYRKGLNQLLEAYSLLKRNDTALIIFSVMSKEEEQQFQNKINSLGIGESTMIYEGWINEEMKKSIFCAADIITLPSLYEPFGLVTLEGLAADLACEMNGVTGPTVVVGDTGGMHEVIKNGVNGFKVPMEEDLFMLNPRYLADIISLIINEPEIRKKVSVGGSERVKSHSFEWHTVCKNIFSMYEKTIDGCGEECKVVKE